MSDTFRIKRRTSSGAAGAPSGLANAELAFNEADNTLYYGYGDNGSAQATSVKPVGGPGAFVDQTSAQNISGAKTFTVSPVAPTPAANDSSTKIATTAFVTSAVGGAGGSQSANSVYAGPSSGASASPSFRSLVSTDIPTLTSAKISDLVSQVNSLIAAMGNVVGGFAPLDTNKLVPAVYLPSYVDDVVEVASFSNLPATGSNIVIYVTQDTNKIYRWSGSAYVEISPSPGSSDAVPEGTTNLYFTPARVLTALSANAAAARSNLGLGTIATQGANAVAITGGTIDGVTFDGGTF